MKNIFRIRTLPPHDFAALISYRYAGGLAFVGGMCTNKAVMLCGVCFSVKNNLKVPVLISSITDGQIV